MLGEALAAAVVGVVALWLVLHPLVAPQTRTRRALEPPDPEETPKGVALTALREIEFDRETGKLSEADYEYLKAKYTAAALDALREDPGSEELDEAESMIAVRARALRSARAAASTSSSTHPQTGSDGRAQVPVCERCGPCPESDALFCSTCGRRLSDGAACPSCGAELTPESRFCAGCGTPVAA